MSKLPGTSDPLNDRIDSLVEKRRRAKEEAALKYGGGFGDRLLYGATSSILGERVASAIATTFRDRSQTEKSYSELYDPSQQTTRGQGESGSVLREIKPILEKINNKVDYLASKIEKIDVRLSTKEITIGKGEEEQTFRYDPLAPEGKQVTAATASGKSGRFASKVESASVLSKAAYLGNQEYQMPQTSTRVSQNDAKQIIEQLKKELTKSDGRENQSQIAATEDRKDYAADEKNERDEEYQEEVIKKLDEILEKTESGGGGGFGTGLGLLGANLLGKLKSVGGAGLGLAGAAIAGVAGTIGSLWNRTQQEDSTTGDLETLASATSSTGMGVAGPSAMSPSQDDFYEAYYGKPLKDLKKPKNLGSTETIASSTSVGGTGVAGPTAMAPGQNDFYESYYGKSLDELKESSSYAFSSPEAFKQTAVDTFDSAMNTFDSAIGAVGSFFGKKTKPKPKENLDSFGPGRKTTDEEFTQGLESEKLGTSDTVLEIMSEYRKDHDKAKEERKQKLREEASKPDADKSKIQWKAERIIQGNWDRSMIQVGGVDEWATFDEIGEGNQIPGMPEGWKIINGFPGKEGLSLSPEQGDDYAKSLKQVPLDSIDSGDKVTNVALKSVRENRLRVREYGKEWTGKPGAKMFTGETTTIETVLPNQTQTIPTSTGASVEENLREAQTQLEMSEEENKTALETASPVINNIDSRTINNVAPSSAPPPPMTVNSRNDETSYGDIAARIFSHPAKHPIA